MARIAALIALALLTGCASRWDSMIDSECARLLAGDELDRASARRLGCE